MRRNILGMSIAANLARLFGKPVSTLSNGKPVSTLSNGERYSMPVNKESFKQARRKQLKARNKKRAKKLGHV